MQRSAVVRCADFLLIQRALLVNKVSAGRVGCQRHVGPVWPRQEPIDRPHTLRRSINQSAIDPHGAVTAGQATAGSTRINPGLSSIWKLSISGRLHRPLLFHYITAVHQNAHASSSSFRCDRIPLPSVILCVIWTVLPCTHAVTAAFFLSYGL